MITVTVDLHVDEVMDQVPTQDLVDELRHRAKRNDGAAKAALGGHGLLLAAERAIDALRADEPAKALEALLQGVEDSPTDIRASWEDARKGEHPFLIVRAPS